MANPLATVNISPELLNPILDQHIRAAMTTALGSSDKIIEAAINQVLYSKCDRNGKISNYSSENTHSFIDIVFKNTIEAAVKEEVNKWVKDNTDNIRIQLNKMLAQKKTQNQFVEALMRGVISCLQSTFSSHVVLKFQADDSRE